MAVSGHFSPLDSYGERLRRAGESVGGAKQQYDDALELRDRIVREAIDEGGLSVAQVARLALMSPARVVQILAKAS